MLALEQRVLPPHDALQLGKLADDLGRQVGFGENRGTVGSLPQSLLFRRQILRGEKLAFEEVRLFRQIVGQFPRQPPDAFHPRALRAELGVEGDAEMIQPRHALVERLLQIEIEFPCQFLQLVEVRQIALVGLPEIQRIRQPRPDYLAVAMDDLDAAVLGLDVGGEDEAVGEVRRPAPRDEALLVGADRQPDDLGRDRQEILLEPAHQHHRPLDQPGHLLQQTLILDKIEPVGEGGFLASARMISLRRSASMMTLAASSFAA